MTGKLPYSRMKLWGGEGSTAGPFWILQIHEDLFPEMLRAIPSMGQRSVSILLDRVRDFTQANQQAEKLDSLGKLAANLAHELNNPASAAQRAARSLASNIERTAELCGLGRLLRSDEELARYKDWTHRATAAIEAAAASETVAASPLAESEREEEFAAWLKTHHVPDAWSTAPLLASAALPIRFLDELASLINPGALCAAVTSFAATLDARSMLKTISVSSQRIFSIIDAIKDYSYMDQAPIQEVDLAQSIENSLAMLRSRLTEISIKREYDPAMPAITAYGGELSQVWTALIENAIDAMKGRGVLSVTTRLSADLAFIEIADDGAGIDPQIASRIFEPFFTTKLLGQGLGLGLDTVQRIVKKHFGSITMRSVENDTCFQVRLPLDRPQLY